ncbi:MAG: hypothetical protein ACW9W3_01045 [Candidatus Nitrosopumilus sp. bin_68KS]
MGDKLQIATIGISLIIVGLLVYNIFLLPPDIFLEIGIASAIHNKAEVEPDYSKIRLLSYPVNGTEKIQFQIKIVNDGGSSARNFLIEMNRIPNTSWLDPSTVPIQTQNYLPCSLASATECHIGIIPKGDSVILEFAGAIDTGIYKEIDNDNPRLEFLYSYDGIEPIKKTVEIELAGIR